MYSDVLTTCFGLFLTGDHQVGIQCQRNNIPTISTDISISVSTEKGWGTRRDEISFTNTERVVRPVLEIHVLTVSA